MFISRKNNHNDSRRQIAIKGARNSILVLSNNMYQAIIKLSALNFELKSDEEQDAIIDSYQSFLNSCGHPLQILVRIRQVDINKYIDDITTQYGNDKNAIYHQQLTNYVHFIKSLITTNQILTRQFYIVIPYSPNKKVDFSIIEEHINMLTDIIVKGINRIGMSAVRLNNLEMINLFYEFYDQKRSKNQPLKNQAMNVLQKLIVRSK